MEQTGEESRPLQVTKYEIVENNAVKFEDLKLNPVKDPVSTTIEISGGESEKRDYYLSECVTSHSEKPKPNIKKAENGTLALVLYGKISAKFRDIVNQIGDQNTEILLKKVFGNDYQLAKEAFDRKQFDNNEKLMMAVIYRMRQDSVNQEQEIFKKHTVDVTAEEVLELTVKTLKDILSENEITADIKLQKNEYAEEQSVN